MDPKSDKERLKPISLHPLTPEQVLRKILDFKVEPKPQKGGRKKKTPQEPDQGSDRP